MTSFKENLKTISPDLMRIARKRTRNKSDAEDLVQEALLKAWEKQHLFKGGNQTAWIVTIMQNLFNDKYRKDKKEIEIEGEEGKNLEKTKWGKYKKTDKVISLEDEETLDYLNANDSTYVDTGIETGVEITDVNRALNAIGKKCKEILLLIAEEYKYKEISERLEIPMGTVTNRLLRCRKKLHQDLYGTSKYNEI